MKGDEGMERNAARDAVLLRLVESTNEYAMFVLDEQGVALTWNPGVEALLGYDREEFIGLPLSALFTDADGTAGLVDRELALARHSGRASDRRLLRRRDGSTILVDGSTIALRDGERLVGYAKIIHSDEERHRLEHDLEAARRGTERFIASVSHELRTPLMAILAWLRVLQDGDAGDEVRAALRIIEHNVMLERRLVEELIDAGRLGDGAIELERVEVDLRAIVDGEVETVRPAASERDLRLETVLPDDPVYVEGDPARLRQVVAALLSNATKFTLERGSVHVALHRHEREAELIVSDSGVGIEPELLARLLRRFERVEPHGGSYGESGLGLGLSIACELVALHGGEISAASDGAGRGSRFVVRLPLVRSRRHGA